MHSIGSENVLVDWSWGLSLWINCTFGDAHSCKYMVLSNKYFTHIEIRFIISYISITLRRFVGIHLYVDIITYSCYHDSSTDQFFHILQFSLFFAAKYISIFIIKGFRTIVFIVIFPTFRPIRPPVFFRCLSNTGTSNYVLYWIHRGWSPLLIPLAITGYKC